MKTAHIKMDIMDICVLGGRNILEKKDRKFREYRKKWKEQPENFHAGSFPLFIDIESTSLCNLRCSFCYNRQRIRGGRIEFGLVKKIIDEGADNGLYGVKFNFRGEPLLHPQIHEFVKYAKDKGLIDVYFNTNALNLNNDLALKLIEARLDRISISFEGYTKKVYEKYRRGSNFEIVVSNLSDLVKLRKKSGADYPKIRVQSVLVPEVEEHLQEYKNFWLDFGVDEVAYLDYQERKMLRKGLIYPIACPQLWQRACVWWNGTFTACNHEYRNQISLGNVRESSIKDMWNSEKVKKIRELHKRGLSHLVPACDGCYLRDSKIRKYTERKETICQR